MDFYLENLGSAGIVKDIISKLLPPAVWSGGRNVRFDNNSIKQILGWKNILDIYSEAGEFVSAPETIYAVYPLKIEEFTFFILVGLDKNGKDSAYLVGRNGRSKILTPVEWLENTPVIKDSIKFSGGNFDGTAIITYGKDSRIYYVAPNFLSLKLTELRYGVDEDGEDIPLSSKLGFNVLRPMWQYLFGLGVTVKEETDSLPVGYYPRLLWFSDIANPGQIPGSWEASDPTTASRYFPDPFAGYTGDLVDMVQLGQFAVVYQENACHVIVHTGQPPSFVGVKTAFNEIGAIATNCVVPIRGQHVVLTDQDLLFHNTQTAQSLLDTKLRKWLFRNIDSRNYKNSFVTGNIQANEVWVCFPESGETYPNLAIVWNYEENTTSIRELASDTTFATEAKQSCLGVGEYTAYTHSLFTSAKDEENSFLLMNSGNLFGKEKPVSYIEKEDFILDGNPKTIKLLTKVWPEILGTSPVEIFLGRRRNASADIIWEEGISFNPLTQTNLPVTDKGLRGPYHSIKISWCKGTDVEISRIGFEYQVIGMLQ